MTWHVIMWLSIALVAGFIGGILVTAYSFRRLRKRLEWMTAVANGEHLKVVTMRRNGRP